MKSAELDNLAQAAVKQAIFAIKKAFRDAGVPLNPEPSEPTPSEIRSLTIYEIAQELAGIGYRMSFGVYKSERDK